MLDVTWIGKRKGRFAYPPLPLVGGWVVWRAEGRFQTCPYGEGVECRGAWERWIQAASVFTGAGSSREQRGRDGSPHPETFA